MTLYKKNIGAIGEQKAVQFLKTNGYSILKKNFRSYIGEIDIIAKKEKAIYFIEVKTRTNLSKGQPWEAINKRKIYNIKRTSDYFLLKYGFKDYKLKIGLISIILENGTDKLKFYEDVEGR